MSPTRTTSQDEEDLSVRSDGPITRARIRAITQATSSIIARAIASHDATTGAPLSTCLVTIAAPSLQPDASHRSAENHLLGTVLVASVEPHATPGHPGVGT